MICYHDNIRFLDYFSGKRIGFSVIFMKIETSVKFLSGFNQLPDRHQVAKKNYRHYESSQPAERKDIYNQIGLIEPKTLER